MRFLCLLSAFLIPLLSGPLLATEIDTDKDGLIDFEEVHKYFTDPQLADSDGDGIDDADWHERREYTYTIRSVVKVMHPCDADAANDAYQDARVLSENENYVELEVIHYPLNSYESAKQLDEGRVEDSRNRFTWVLVLPQTMTVPCAKTFSPNSVLPGLIQMPPIRTHL